MTIKEICDYIEILDYIDYRIFYTQKTFGDPHTRLLLSKYRYMRHKMHELAADYIARGDY